MNINAWAITSSLKGGYCLALYFEPGSPSATSSGQLYHYLPGTGLNLRETRKKSETLPSFPAPARALVSNPLLCMETPLLLACAAGTIRG